MYIYIYVCVCVCVPVSIYLFTDLFLRILYLYLYPHDIPLSDYTPVLKPIALTGPLVHGQSAPAFGDYVKVAAESRGILINKGMPLVI